MSYGVPELIRWMAPSVNCPKSGFTGSAMVA